jgi:hypothetical protein
VLLAVLGGVLLAVLWFVPGDPPRRVVLQKLRRLRARLERRKREDARG